MRHWHASLEAHGLTYFTGLGIPDNPGWTPEESFPVVGISGDDAAFLGRRFGQAAIVVGIAGESARLVDLEEDQ